MALYRIGQHGQASIGHREGVRIESLLPEYAKVDLSESFPNKNVE